MKLAKDFQSKIGKKKLLFFLLSLVITQGFAQVTNVKVGLWSDKTVWSNNSLPNSIDDVALNFDITVDINAICQSLALNGHNVTISAGANLNITGNTNGTTLSMYIEIDTTAFAPFDTISKTLFYYDNVKRNTGIDLSYYDNGVLSPQQYKSLFFYNGNDSLPFKKIVTSPFLLNTDSRFYEIEQFYFYTNSRLTKDSSIQISGSTPHTIVTNYDYNNLGIIQTSTSYDTAPLPVYTKTDTFYLQRVNGNIVKQIDTAFGYFSVNSFEFTYDNHPNPFYHTQSRISLDNSYPIYSIETTIEEVFEKNNVTEINEFDGTYNYHYKFIYDYKPNGYPKAVRFYDQNSSTNFGKALFFYSN
ncbi:MAG: hypothetical protein JWP81_2819 [Ferruginibacter sp.]|nr:hypothetical protein [Ferruginibacter sp.]